MSSLADVTASAVVLALCMLMFFTLSFCLVTHGYRNGHGEHVHEHEKKVKAVPPSSAAHTHTHMHTSAPCTRVHIDEDTTAQSTLVPTANNHAMREAVELALLHLPTRSPPPPLRHLIPSVVASNDRTVSSYRNASSEQTLSRNVIAASNLMPPDLFAGPVAGAQSKQLNSTNASTAATSSTSPLPPVRAQHHVHFEAPTQQSAYRLSPLTVPLPPLPLSRTPSPTSLTKSIRLTVPVAVPSPGGRTTNLRSIPLQSIIPSVSNQQAQGPPVIEEEDFHPSTHDNFARGTGEITTG